MPCSHAKAAEDRPDYGRHRTAASELLRCRRRRETRAARGECARAECRSSPGNCAYLGCIGDLRHTSPLVPRRSFLEPSCRPSRRSDRPNNTPTPPPFVPHLTALIAFTHGPPRPPLPSTLDEEPRQTSLHRC